MTMITGDQIDMLRVVTIRRYLRLEVERGIRSRRPVLPFAKQILEWNDIVPKRNKKDVLAQMDVLLAEYDEFMKQAEKEL
jgi:hypothetical protein|tara:strand:- start:1082 stop:1321 length:240 start_codon:yes stop_codon:yes gene_type:complete